jgi:hypothetical protein
MIESGLNFPSHARLSELRHELRTSYNLPRIDAFVRSIEFREYRIGVLISHDIGARRAIQVSQIEPGTISGGVGGTAPEH